MECSSWSGRTGGAGAACRTPSMSSRVLRAATCGCSATSSGARTGVTHASDSAKTAAPTRRTGTPAIVSWSPRCTKRGKAINTASVFEVDDVIDPADTRELLTRLLAEHQGP